MTTRTLTHPEPGPVNLNARSVCADIHITAGEEVERARIDISTAAEDGPSAQAVHAAVLTHSHGSISVRLEDDDTSGATVLTGTGVSINSSGGITIVGNSHGSTIISDGQVWIDGEEVTTNPASSAPATTVRIDVYLPAHSSISVDSVNGDIHAVGPLKDAIAGTTNGDIKVSLAGYSQLHTVAGRIDLEQARTARLSTTAGRIKVGVVGDISAESVAGNITVADAYGHATLRTTSGRIEAGYSGVTRPRAESIAGRVRIYHVVNRPATFGLDESGPAPRDAAPEDAPAAAIAQPEPEDAVPPGFTPRPRRPVEEPQDAVPPGYRPRRRTRWPWTVR